MSDRRFELLKGRRAIGVALVATLSIAAAGPRALAPASGGLWQVAHNAREEGELGLCVADPVSLGMWQHRKGRCKPVIVSDQGNKAVIEYSCADGGFGRSEMTLLTPRTLRIATQGIAAGAPFNYVLHARRSGNCPRR